jgi:hypothetical protein
MRQDVGESRATAALRARLARGELTEDDRAQVVRCEQIRRGLDAKQSYSEIGETMGEKANSLLVFTRRPSYAVYCAYLDSAQHARDEEILAAALRRGRVGIAGCVPDAVRYIQEAFRRHPSGTKRTISGREIDLSDTPFDDGKAMWATELVSKSTGLMDPPTVKAPTLVNPTFINNTIHMSRADDTEAARAAIDVTAVETIDAAPGPA